MIAAFAGWSGAATGAAQYLIDRCYTTKVC